MKCRAISAAQPLRACGNALTWKLFAMSTRLPRPNSAAVAAPSAGVVMLSSSPEMTSAGTSGYAAFGAVGRPAGCPAGATGHATHWSMKL